MATSNSVEKAEEQGLYIYKKEDLDNKKEVGGVREKEDKVGTDYSRQEATGEGASSLAMALALLCCLSKVV